MAFIEANKTNFLEGEIPTLSFIFYWHHLPNLKKQKILMNFNKCLPTINGISDKTGFCF